MANLSAEDAEYIRSRLDGAAPKELLLKEQQEFERDIAAIKDRTAIRIMAIFCATIVTFSFLFISYAECRLEGWC